MTFIDTTIGIVKERNNTNNDKMQDIGARQQTCQLSITTLQSDNWIEATYIQRMK